MTSDDFSRLVMQSLGRIEVKLDEMQAATLERTNACWRTFATKREVRAGLLTLGSLMAIGFLVLSYRPEAIKEVVGGAIKFIK